eukprot:GEZU01027812.1.p1 GENE.GEZU01027812.1~~GEZU01027812.1.p1  ORF type:complete len:1956 (-),score=1147.30 GEZU01027812.1:298-6141(-)
MSDTTKKVTKKAGTKKAAAGEKYTTLRSKKKSNKTQFDKLLKVQKAYASWTGKNYYWVPHPTEVFCLAEVIKENADGTTECLTEYGQTLVVKKEDVQPTNPPKFDGIEDLGGLSNLNEPSVFHNLKLRYHMDLIYTYSGLFLVAINPFKNLGIYTPEFVDNFKGKRREDVPPHIFAVADAAYRAMLNDRRNQSMLITGESGAGKTENTKKVIQYLTSIAGHSTGGSLEQQILRCNPVMEAFGNAKTTRNNNSSRFGKFIEIQFNAAGYIAGCSIQTYLLEKSRVVSQGERERNFHIFYQLLEGASDEMVEKYSLLEPAAYNYLNKSGCYKVDGINDEAEFRDLLQSLSILGLSDDEIDFLLRTISAILHLGNFNFKYNGNDSYIENKETLKIAANLLGLGNDAEKLELGICKPNLKVGKSEVVRTSQTIEQAAYNRDALVKAIYGRMFDWLVEMINKSLANNDRVAHFIGVLDIAGFEIFKINSFEQLCINYTNEKLQQFFNTHMFKKEQEEYLKEQIPWTFIDFGMDLQACIDLIEKQMGVLAILNEQTVFPNANDDTFCQKLRETHKGNPVFSVERFGKTTFNIQHYAGTVTYDTRGWIDKNKDPLNDDLSILMQTSSHAVMRKIFADDAGEEKSKTSLMVKVAQKTEAKKVGTRFMTVSNNHKNQLANLMNILNATDPHFIRCIIPNNNKQAGVLDAPLVLEQLRCNGVLEGIRISRKGYPSRVLYEDFVKRYDILAPPSLVNSGTSARDKTSKILQHIELDTEKYKLGLTKAFFKAGELALLEEQREKKIGELIVGIQAQARGHLARRKHMALIKKVRAAKTIQNNVRSWLQLRDWIWWKMFMKVRPLLNTMKIEERMKEKEQQIADLTAQLEAQTEQAAELEKLKNQMEQELEDYKNQLIQSKEAKMKIEASLSSLEAQIAELTHDLEKEENSRKNLQEEKRNLERRLNDLEDKLDSVKTDKSNLEKTLASKEQFIAELNSKLDAKNKAALDLENAKRALEVDLQKVKEDLEEEEKNSAKLRKLKDNLTAEVKELNDRLEDETREKNNLSKAKSQLESELKNLKKVAAEDAKAKAELENEKALLEAEIARLKGELEIERTMRAQLEAQRKKLEQQLAELEDQMSDEQSQKSGIESLQKKLRLELEETRHNLDVLTEEKMTLEEAKERTEREVDTLRASLNKKDQLNAELQGQIANLERQLDATKSQASDELDRAKTELEKIRKKLEAEANELREQLENANNTIAALDKEKAKLMKAAVDAKKSLDTEAKNKASLEETVQRLENELSAAKAQIVEEQKKANDTQRERRNIEAQLHELQEKLEEEESNRQRIESQRKQLLAENQELRAQLDENEEIILSADEAKAAAEAECEKLRRNLKIEKEQKQMLEKQNDIMERELNNLRVTAGEATKVNAEQLEKARKALELELRQANEQLRAEADSKAKILNENKKVKQENIDTKKQLNAVQAKIQEAEERAARAEAALNDYKKQVDAEKAAAQQAEQTVRNLKNQLEEAQERISEMESDHSRQVAKVRRLESEVADLRAQVEDADEIQAELEDARNTYEAKISQLQRELSAARAERDRVEESIDQYKKEVENAKAQLAEELNKAKKELSNAKKKLESDNRELQAQVASMKQELVDAQTEVRQSRRVISDLQKQIDNASSNKDADEQVRRLQQQLNAMKEELNSGNAAKAELERLRKQYKAEIEDLKEQLEEAQSKQKRAESAKKALENELQDLHDQLDEADGAASEADELRAQLDEKQAQFRAQLAKANEQISAAEEEASKAKRELEAIKKAVEEENQKRAAEIKKLKQKHQEEIEELEQQVTASRRRSSDASMTNRLQSKIRELERKVADADAARQTAEDAVTKLNSELRKTKNLADQANSRIMQVEAENRQLVLELDEWKYKQSEYTSEIQRLKAALDREKAASQAMQDKLMNFFK